MTWTARRLAASLGLFLALMVVGAWPWAPVPHGFSALYCPVANLVLAPQTFGHGGHARLVPLDHIVRQESDNVTADTALSLTVAGFEGDLQLGMSLRRDAYLPLLILVALIVAAPLPAVGRLKALSIGVPIMTALNLAALELLVVWTFALQLKGIYDPTGAARGLVDFAYGALLTPPGNRFIAPLALGAAIVAWQKSKPGPIPSCHRNVTEASPEAGYSGPELGSLDSRRKPCGD